MTGIHDALKRIECERDISLGRLAQETNLGMDEVEAIQSGDIASITFKGLCKVAAYFHVVPFVLRRDGEVIDPMGILPFVYIEPETAMGCYLVEVLGESVQDGYATVCQLAEVGCTSKNYMSQLIVSRVPMMGLPPPDKINKIIPRMGELSTAIKCSIDYFVSLKGIQLPYDPPGNDQIVDYIQTVYGKLDYTIAQGDVRKVRDFVAENSADVRRYAIILNLLTRKLYDIDGKLKKMWKTKEKRLKRQLNRLYLEERGWLKRGLL